MTVGNNVDLCPQLLGCDSEHEIWVLYAKRSMTVVISFWWGVQSVLLLLPVALALLLFFLGPPTSVGAPFRPLLIQPGPLQHCSCHIHHGCLSFPILKRWSRGSGMNTTSKRCTWNQYSSFQERCMLEYNSKQSYQLTCIFQHFP